jgi:hypothetical protein
MYIKVKPMTSTHLLAELELMNKGQQVVAQEKNHQYMIIAGIVMVIGMGMLVVLYEQKLAHQQQYYQNLLFKEKIE